MKNMLKEETLKYILHFLLRKYDFEVEKYFSYCGIDEIDKKKIVIIQSDFFQKKVFGTKESIPDASIEFFNGLPILFGGNKVEYKNGQAIIYADIIASSFFFISRYEELIQNNNRDKYGRIIGKESLIYKLGCIDRPIVDEYGKWLRSVMRNVGIQIEEPDSKLNEIYLTHDIDSPWETFTFYTAIKRILGIAKREKRIVLYPLLNRLGFPENDYNYYTFQEILWMDKQIQGAKSVYFVKSGGNHVPEDDKIYITSRAGKRLLNVLQKNGVDLGYHVSYEASMNPDCIMKELNLLRQNCRNSVKAARYHYLATREPLDYFDLIDSGIKDDYTMGFADVAGFRLGTCHAIQWINPYTTELTELTIHPMMVMDCTLYEQDYMNLSINEAKSYVQRLLDETKKHNGDWCILWHNQNYRLKEWCTELILNLKY